MNTALIEEASNEIAEYNATEAGLAELRARMANVHYDCTTVKGMVIAKADRAEVRGLRTGLETMRKQIKAPALAHCKLIDAEAARITTALLELETPIDAQIKARELVLENERLAREQAEQAAAAAQLAKERAELAEAHEALARQVAEAKAQAAAIAAKQLAEAIEVMVVTPATAPVIAETVAPVIVRRPPPARTAPPVIAAPVARVYADDVPTGADIFAMCMESATADNFVKWLCAAAGVAYPPVNQ